MRAALILSAIAAVSATTMRFNKKNVVVPAPAVEVIPPYNLVQRLILIPDMSTLVTAVVAANLQGTLSGAGPFTLFAPDNGAFAQLPPGALPAILANKTLLTEILTYHVVSGNVTSNQLKNNEEVPTIEGRNITVEIYTPPGPNGQKAILLDHDSRVLFPDNLVTNGVFHQIDRVLLPPRHMMSKGMQAVFDKAAVVEQRKEAAIPPLSLFARLELIPEMGDLVVAIKAAGLASTLSTGGPFTIFAPNTEAFQRIPNLPAILGNKTLLTEILTYHVVAGNVSSSQLTNDEEVKTLNGATVKVNIFTDKEKKTIVVLNDKTPLLELDNYATNGVFHISSGVLIPPKL